MKMTDTEWKKIKRCVEKYGYYVFKDRAAIYSHDVRYGKEYSARDKANQTITTDWDLDRLRYLFDD